MASFAFNSPPPQGMKGSKRPEWLRPAAFSSNNKKAPAAGLLKTLAVPVDASLSDNDNMDWSERLVWVHRNKEGDKKYCCHWPGIYYYGWEEAAKYCARDEAMSKQQKADFALRIYEQSVKAMTVALSPTEPKQDAAAATYVVRLLGVEPLEFIELETQGAQPDFVGEFVGWAPQVIMTYHDPSAFEDGPLEWYLPLMKGMDEAFAMLKPKGSSKNKATTSMFAKGQQLLAAYQGAKKNKDKGDQGQAKDPTTPGSESPKNQSASEVSPSTFLSDSTPMHSNKSPKHSSSPVVETPSDQPASEVSPSSSSSEATPMHSNKSPKHSSSLSANMQSRDLFPHKKTTKKTKKNATASPTTTKDAASTTKQTLKSPPSAPQVSPATSAKTPVQCRSSSRPKRKAVQKTDSLTPTSSRTSASIRRENDDDDFYSFRNLIKVLTQKLGWQYRHAKSQFQTWVYERVDTPGEEGGAYLEDYFYEESDVVEYCRRNGYKERFGNLIENKNTTGSNNRATPTQDGNHDETGAVITPPTAKRVCNHDIAV